MYPIDSVSVENPEHNTPQLGLIYIFNINDYFLMFLEAI